jgi:DNA-binding LacI/PurR family transcriptional regulator
VRQPAYELGRQAAELLISDIEGSMSTGIRKIVHTPELIIRSSTDGHPAEIKAG